MIAQREEDIEVRTALTAKNRTLTASLERTKRFHKEELERSADFERKVEASKSKLAYLTTQLESERNAHKATKEALGRLRRDLQAIKASAVQYKASNDRSVGSSPGAYRRGHHFGHSICRARLSDCRFSIRRAACRFVVQSRCGGCVRSAGTGTRTKARPPR